MGTKRIACMEWLQQNLPEVFAEISPAEMLRHKTRKHKPVVVVPDFSAAMRDGRFASIGSIDDLKKYIVTPKE
ncbi:hypothetical protein M3Y99_01620600 [Aphelenchoides fujianensis]|nr:hypothetical protein M3Y99_01620600 [Aphelenchoides fujianensis]